MMKFCCSIVIILCTLGVSHGGILSGICRTSNGTCGRRGFACNETLGSGWKQYGKCCNERPCCKWQCVPETCPVGFKLLPNQSSTNCYLFSGGNDADRRQWNESLSYCMTTPGAYLWRPNTLEEANAVINEFNISDGQFLWTGLNDVDRNNIYTFIIENSTFNGAAPPFGKVEGSFYVNTDCVSIRNVDSMGWVWNDKYCYIVHNYICEYPRSVCP